jgi:anaerobic selenocysteine-containing dehydrogenase
MSDEQALSENPRPNLSRRDFFKFGASASVAGLATWMFRSGKKAPLLQGGLANSSAGETFVKTTCRLCPSGCGLEVRVSGGRAVKVDGNPLHPLNQGVCCLKGQTSLEVLYSPERLAGPLLQIGERGSQAWKAISWDEALGMLANRLGDLRKTNLAHTLAVVHGDTRGQERALLQQFMTAYGSPNLIASTGQGEQLVRQAVFLTQGINGLPVYDLNNCNYAITFGGNLLESSRSLIGYLGSLAFMRRGRPTRGKLVAVHPRLGITGCKADEWVPIRPGTYAALALGMANVIINSQLYDEQFVRDFTFGFEDFEDENGRIHLGYKSIVLEQYSLERASTITGVAPEVIARLAGEFATNRPAVAILPTEAGELANGNGLYTAMAVHALNALVGSIDCPGGVLVQRFPQVAAFPEPVLDSAARSGLSQARIDGAGSSTYPLAGSASQRVPQAVLDGHDYPINALLLFNANPVQEAPSGTDWANALLKIPFVVSFAPTLDASAAHADLILPSSTFLEVWGDDFVEGSGFAGVSLRQPVIEPLYNTRNPCDVLLHLANRLEGSLSQALPYRDYRALVRHRLSVSGLDWDKFIDNGCWSEMVYFNALPGSPAWHKVVGRDRLNAPHDGRFDFFSRELFSALQDPADEDCLPHFKVPSSLAEYSPDAASYPLLLVSQQIITQSNNWQGIVPTLQECYGLQAHVKWDSWVEINPHTAHRLGIEDGDQVWVESSTGRVKAFAHLYPGLWPNAVFMPEGQGHFTQIRWGRHSPGAMQVGANPNQLLKAGVEPLNGHPVLGPTRVTIYPA